MNRNFNLPFDEVFERIESLEKRIAYFESQSSVSSQPDKQWYSVKEAAVYLNVSIKSIRRLIQRGILKRSLGLRIIRISAESLKNYKRITESK